MPSESPDGAALVAALPPQAASKSRATTNRERYRVFMLLGRRSIENRFPAGRSRDSSPALALEVGDHLRGYGRLQPLANGSTLVSNYHQRVGGGFGAPDLTGAAEELANVAARATAAGTNRMSRWPGRIARSRRCRVKSVSHTRSVSST